MTEECEWEREVYLHFWIQSSRPRRGRDQSRISVPSPHYPRGPLQVHHSMQGYRKYPKFFFSQNPQILEPSHPRKKKKQVNVSQRRFFLSFVHFSPLEFFWLLRYCSSGCTLFLARTFRQGSPFTQVRLSSASVSITKGGLTMVTIR